MMDVCLNCGDIGVYEALTFCHNCKVYAVHLYCLSEIPDDLDGVVWLCEDCEPEAQKFSSLDKCSHDYQSLGSVHDKENDSLTESLNIRSKDLDLEKGLPLQLDSENADSDHENQRHCESADTCSMEEAVETTESNQLQLDLGQSPELEMDGPDERETHEMCRELVAVTESSRQGIDVSEIDWCESSKEQQLVTFQSSDIIAQPIEQPSWRGRLNIADKHNHIDGSVELTAHLSSLAGARASEEVKYFPMLLSSELLPRSTLWPKSFAKLGPSYDNIALYFFPDSERSERVYHSLVNEMIDRDLGIRAVVQNADLLIFTSTLMPMDYWRFQAKYYLWGVFKAKEVKSGTQVSERHSPFSPLSNDQRCSTASISTSVVTELNNGLKLNGDNYETWSMKIQYILEDQEVADTIRTVMAKPKEGTNVQHRIDQEFYESWKKRNSHARRILLSAMDDNIAKQFHKYEIAKDLWESLKVKFEGVSSTKLRSLLIKFNSYKKHQDHSMKRHLREMSNMISELDGAGYKLTELQKVQALIRSLPHNWEHMRMHLIHAKSIKTFDDAIRHLELEDHRQVSIKINVKTHYAYTTNSFGVYGKKRKRFSDKGKEKQNQPMQANLPGQKKNKKKVNVSKVKCYRCQQMGHYARDCKFNGQSFGDP